VAERAPLSLPIAVAVAKGVPLTLCCAETVAANVGWDEVE
jgi:hypothetical protein